MKLKVIFFEDDWRDAEMVSRKLEAIADTTVCGDVDKFEQHLKSEFDIILVDWSVPGISGEQTIALAKTAQPNTPILIITGSIDDAHGASVACRYGAADILLKDRIERLPQAVQTAHDNHLLRLHTLREQRLELLGELSTGLAHDLNNVLAVIIAGAEMLRGRVNSADQRIIDAILSSSRRGAEMLTQMLAFARGLNGSAFKTVTAEYLMGEIGLMLRGTFPANVRVKIETVPGTSKVRCDPVQINQVFLNLCVNARDAMPAGGELSLKAQNVEIEKDLGFVVFTVRDTGTGMTEETLSKLFTPFFTTKAIGKGTGIGLSMVRNILAMHGGRVDAQSGPKGTTFHFYLPIAGENAKPEKKYDGHGRTILLVDDEEVLMTWCALFMEEANYKVIAASNGPEAMNIFIEHMDGIWALVTDIGLGVMSGEQLANALLEVRPDLPIIYISGSETDAPRNPPANANLRKPFDREKLLDALAAVLTTSGPAEQTEA